MLHNVKIYPGTHPTSHSGGAEGLLQWVKWPGREPEHSLPSTTGVQHVQCYISTPTRVFMPHTG